jgi:glyoxylase-like metal-dependent hydrolase (beta-lactamase superfamily II)
MSDDAPEEEIPYRREFNTKAGELVRLSPLVRRIVANNPGPFTFTGTCTYVVGQGRVAVIDPGPDDPAHIAAILSALGDETIVASLVTHTHRDHSPGARLLKQATGAEIIGCGPYEPARDLVLGEINALDAANDQAHMPDRLLHDGEVFQGEGFSLACVETPGHTANHLTFALPEEQALFSGDHVMAWSTTIVAPPDGAMQPYMTSLEKLLARDDIVYWPGHGGPVEEPRRFVRALRHHRRARETAIFERLKAGDTKIEAIVAAIYKDLDPRLRGAAALSVFAHLEDLAARGSVAADGPVTLTASYRPG